MFMAINPIIIMEYCTSDTSQVANISLLMFHRPLPYTWNKLTMILI